MSWLSFSPENDPGSNLLELLRRAGADPFPADLPARVDAARVNEMMEQAAKGELPSATVRNTTVLALECVDGVVIAGDRRLTAGNLIRQRDTQKVFPTDTHSAVAVSGAAGPAFQMVKLFQLQLQYYEKIEGRPLSLAGKANQLATMVRANLPQAMAGLVVVPLFAGYDRRSGDGGLFEFDVTGGHYSRTDDGYAVSGSGSLHAGTVLSMGFANGLSTDAALTLAAQALTQASSFDSATGGPDAARGIFPTMAVIDANGFAELPAAQARDIFVAAGGTAGGAAVTDPEVSSP